MVSEKAVWRNSQKEAKVKIKRIEFDFSIGKVEDYSQVNLERDYCFIGRTDEEKSIVCPTKYVPDNIIECDKGWRAFRIEGILDFSLTGILSRISTLLADNGIGIFAISTYNTDYILTKKEVYSKALDILEKAGYEVV